jgi:hypothetical protein
MFRDMVLNHIIAGQASRLEEFITDPVTSPMLKYVK